MSAFHGLQGSYSPTEILILESVFEETCCELGMDPNLLDGDAGRGARALIMALIDATQFDEFNHHQLKTNALLALKAAGKGTKAT